VYHTLLIIFVTCDYFLIERLIDYFHFYIIFSDFAGFSMF